MLSPLPRRSGWAYFLLCFTQPYQPSPKGLSGRPAHCPFRGLLSVHSRYGLHARAVTVYRAPLSEGFSHLVTSTAAPVASGWSGCRVGLAPTGRRRLLTAHAKTGLMTAVQISKLSTSWGQKLTYDLAHLALLATLAACPIAFMLRLWDGRTGNRIQERSRHEGASARR